ncbi:MAG TPA: hypothetical protein VE782_09550, partial [Myxococcaceae bacterium]|nr:hypothetical protein [Myxococcaceae bacterium]
MRSPTLLAAVLLLASAAGCARCSKVEQATPGADARRYLPQDVELAVMVPELGVLGDRIRQLQGLKLASFVAQLEGFPSADAFADALVQQVGVDIRSRQALGKAGVAADRPLGIAVLPGGDALAVVPVSDPKAFRAALETIARDRLGAPASAASRTAQGREVVTFSPGGGSPPQLGFVLVGGFALVATRAQVGTLGERSALTEEQSLARDAQLEASLGRLPPGRDAVVYRPAGRGDGVTDPLVAGTAVLRLESRALRAFIDVPWQGSEATLAAFEKKEARDLSHQLPLDAFLVARFNGDPAQLQALWPRLAGPRLETAFREAKLDIEHEVLANLQPGLVASLSLSPSIPLGAGLPELSVQQTNPFRYVHLVAIAQAKDGAKVTPVLSRMPEVAPKFGARIQPVEKNGRTLFVTRYAQGEGVHFVEAQDGRVVLASPLDRLERTIARLADGAGPPLLADPELREALSAHALAAALDLNQLRASVKA